jgi:hypothetical protein
MMMSLPLTGVRVLDLTNLLAGPFCGYNLARMGAEVIKIENPVGGDLARQLGADPAMSKKQFGLSFVAVNAGKQSVALDLKSPAGSPAPASCWTSPTRRRRRRPNWAPTQGAGSPQLAMTTPRSRR